MPTISFFYGITIRMYYDDHQPPHFHVYYAEHDAVFSIETLETRRGKLPRRAETLALEWLHGIRRSFLKIGGLLKLISP